MSVVTLSNIFEYMLCIVVFSDSSWTIILIDIVCSDQVCVLYASSRKRAREERIGVGIPDEFGPVLLARFT